MMAGRGKRAGKASSEAGWVMPHWWLETAQAIVYDSSTCPPPITLVCGAGNSGKSTFSRVLLNTLLSRYQRVGYLDTDVGQPEFTTPGCVSLHIIDKQTPDLTILHLKTPERCFFFGDICAQRDPKFYLENIFGLYNYFLSEYYQSTELDKPGKPKLPLVINTSGWVKGQGYDVLVKMLRYMSPSHVVQIRISVEHKNLPTGMFWLDGNQRGLVNLFEICSAYKEPLKRPALIKKDARIIRDIRFIAYFRQCLPRDLDISTHKELVHNLASICPHEVSLSKIKVQHLHGQASSSGLYHLLNATIVGLAISSWVPASSEHCTPWCVGLGIVRIVDVSKDLLYLITPVPHSTLEKVDLLLQGSIEIPTWLVQVCGSSSFCVSRNVRESSSSYVSRNVDHKLKQPGEDVHAARAAKQLSKLQLH